MNGKFFKQHPVYDIEFPGVCHRNDVRELVVLLNITLREPNGLVLKRQGPFSKVPEHFIEALVHECIKPNLCFYNIPALECSKI